MLTPAVPTIQPASRNCYVEGFCRAIRRSRVRILSRARCGYGGACRKGRVAWWAIIREPVASACIRPSVTACRRSCRRRLLEAKKTRSIIDTVQKSVAGFPAIESNQGLGTWAVEGRPESAVVGLCAAHERSFAVTLRHSTCRELVEASCRPQCHKIGFSTMEQIKQHNQLNSKCSYEGEIQLSFHGAACNCQWIPTLPETMGRRQDELNPKNTDG